MENNASIILILLMMIDINTIIRQLTFLRA